MKDWVLWLVAAMAMAIAVSMIRAEESVPLSQVTTEQKLDYQRARASIAIAQQQLEAAQKALSDSVSAMQATCGDRPLIADAKGDPTCGVKAQPAEKAK